MGIWRTILRAELALAVAAVVVTYANFWLWRAEITRGLEALVNEFVAAHIPDANGG